MPTTNQTSRAPNRNSRASDSRFTRVSRDQIAPNFALLLPAGRPCGMKAATEARIAARTPAMIQTAVWNPASASSAAPRKNPAPLTAFFDPVSHATQRKSAPSDGASSLTADFDDILARSLATPLAPCTAITKATEAATPQPGSSCASAASAAICRARPA